MPPVPKVALARPGPGAALADERGLLVAGHPADRGAPGEGAWPGPNTPAESTIVGSTAVGDAQRARAAGSSQPRSVEAHQPGHAGVGGVGDVEAAAARRGSRPPRCRRCRSTGRLGPAARRGRRRRGWRPAWWPTRWGPAGCPRPGGPGRCRPCAGPASRWPGPRARRWPGPRRWSRPAGWRCRRRRPARPRPGLAVATSSTASAMRRGVELDEARAPAMSGRTATWWTWSTAPSGRDDGGPHARGADVDHEDAHRSRLTASRPRRTGDGQPELARVEDAAGVEGVLDRGEHVEAGAQGRRP